MLFYNYTFSKLVSPPSLPKTARKKGDPCTVFSVCVLFYLYLFIYMRIQVSCKKI